MTDLEIVRKCAEAMGYEVSEYQSRPNVLIVSVAGSPYSFDYDPLHDRAEAMELVEKLRVSIHFMDSEGVWTAFCCQSPLERGVRTYDANLLRAICSCVANMEGK